jgi:MoaA/NifB/PqqE/SkfB family radical SAM enzyme
MNKLWNTQDVNMIHVELSTFCNANCPACPRYFPGSTVVRSGLETTSVSLQQFETWFDEDIVKQIKHWRFCGTHGDPMMAKDVIDIIEYIFSTNSSAEISINTNGGMRSIVDWEYLGKISYEHKLKMIFSIDGLKDTNHIYRRNVLWNSLIDNVTAFINSGGHAVWEFLKFRHNENQIDEAKELSKKLGFRQFVLKNPIGFDHLDGIKDMPVFDKNGDYDYSIFPPTLFNGTDSRESKIHYQSRDNLLKFWKSNTENIINKYKTSVNSFVDDIQVTKTEINCMSKSMACDKYGKGSEIYVNVKGIVYPCCFIGTSLDAFDTSIAALQLHSRINDIGRNKFNLNIISLKEILNSKQLNKFTENTWDTEQCLVFCKQTCGKSISLIDKLYNNNK